MPTLTIIRGLPGSGKSTLARKLAEKTGAIHIEPDMFCMQDGKYIYTQNNYENAFANARVIISRLAHKMGCDIIFADVLPQTEQVYSFWYLIPSNYKLVVWDLKITKEEALKRNKHNVHPEDIEKMAADWQDLRDTDCNQLPELVAEVFDRPDCPEWANYAGIHDGKVFAYYREDPRTDDAPMAVHWFDYVKRQEKDTLPDWCKVGEWVSYLDYDTDEHRYFKIGRIDEEGYLYSDNDDIHYMCAKQARVRPWTFEEAPPFIKGKDKNGDLFIAPLCFDYIKNIFGYVTNSKNMSAVGCKSFGEMAEHYTNLDGSPCGVLEHLEDGKWVE